MPSQSLFVCSSTALARHTFHGFPRGFAGVHVLSKLSCPLSPTAIALAHSQFDQAASHLEMVRRGRASHSPGMGQIVAASTTDALELAWGSPGRRKPEFP